MAPAKTSLDRAIRNAALDDAVELTKAALQSAKPSPLEIVGENQAAGFLREMYRVLKELHEDAGVKDND